MEAEAVMEIQKKTPASGPIGAESFEDNESSDSEEEKVHYSVCLYSIQRDWTGFDSPL